MLPDKPYEPTIHLDGYALTHDAEPRGDPSRGGWIERIERQALQEAVGRNPTVPLTINFGKTIGTARLSVDEAGLRVEADIEPAQAVQAGIDEGIPYHVLTHSTAVRQAANHATNTFGIGYAVKNQVWENENELRTILGLTITGVSIANDPVQQPGLSAQVE